MWCLKCQKIVETPGKVNKVPCIPCLYHYCTMRSSLRFWQVQWKPLVGLVCFGSGFVLHQMCQRHQCRQRLTGCILNGLRAPGNCVNLSSHA